MIDDNAPKVMKQYKPSELVTLNSDEITALQQRQDVEALHFFDENRTKLSFLSEGKQEELFENFDNTMEKLRLLFEAVISGFSTDRKIGFPEQIYAIDLKTGEIETDRNGRKIGYSTEVVAPCTSTLLHYINGDCNDVYVVLPPIKSPERTFEKLVSECRFEYSNRKKKIWEKLESISDDCYDDFDMPFSLVEMLRQHDRTLPPTVYASCPLKEMQNGKIVKGVFKDLTMIDILPKDIYRLSITSKYPGDLLDLIKQLEKRFPRYIKFEGGERNRYKKNLSENDRSYFDVKKTARITIPGTKKFFYVEFQFKQTCMFFAHIRSHLAYEVYRVAEAERLALEKNPNKTETEKKRYLQLRKICKEQQELCVRIHRNAVHQSNMYVMHKILWLEDNSRGLRRKPEHENGLYEVAIEALKRDYIVESYEPFDGATAFITHADEHANKAFYLKSIGILPESFDELGKGAKEHINKAWARLTPADLKDFTRITSMALKYQEVIRSIQQERKSKDKGMPMDNGAVLDMIKVQNEK